MSSNQMPHHYSEPRSFRDSRQTPQQQSQPQSYPHPQASQPFTYPYPYTGHLGGYSGYPFAARQPTSESAYRQNFDMPDFSSLTNSALVNALLTPSTNEHQQDGRGLNSSGASFEPQGKREKRARPSNDVPGELSELSDNDYQDAARKQTQATQTRRPRKQPKRKSTQPSDQEDEYVAHIQYDEDSSPEHVQKPRRSARPKRSLPPVDFPTPEEEEEDEYPSPKKAKPRKAAATRKPRQPQARAGRLIRKKPIGMSVPKTLSEAGPADRMMWEWKNSGKNWEEIRSEWKKLTGIEPGGSSLSVRYIKLVENLARNGAGGDIELLRFKKEAEEELLSQLWNKVAEKMYSYSPESEHNPKDLQKRYNMIVRSGYDVEELLRDDLAEKEKQKEYKPQVMKDNNYDDDADMDVNAVNTYDDQVANRTATGIREHDASTFSSSRHAFPKYTHAHSPVSHGHGNIFEQSDIMHQDGQGINDHNHFDDSKMQVGNSYDTILPLFNARDMPMSPFSASKRTRYESSQQRAPVAGTLVRYDTDSE